MDNDHDILKQFGGKAQNELNSVLKLDEDLDDREQMAFIKSTYADFDNLPSMKLTKKFCFYNNFVSNGRIVTTKYATFLSKLYFLILKLSDFKKNFELENVRTTKYFDIKMF